MESIHHHTDLGLVHSEESAFDVVLGPHGEDGFKHLLPKVHHCSELGVLLHDVGDSLILFELLFLVFVVHEGRDVYAVLQPILLNQNTIQQLVGV